MGETAFDFRAGSTAVLFQDKPLAALTPWVLRSAAAAGAAGLSFVVLTPASTRITFPLSRLLEEPGCRWLATGADGTLFDGLTGRVHVWEGEEPAAQDALADEFLAAERRQRGYAQMRASTLHPAADSTLAGAFTERMFRAVTGAPPLAWGVAEPATEAWNVAAASGFCRNRSPRSTRLVVVGTDAGGQAAGAPGSVGVMTVERTSRGVLETVEILVRADGPPDAELLQSFAAGAHGARARSAVLGYGLGYDRLNRPARLTGLVVPQCAVFGPEAVSGIGAEAALAAAGPSARLLGPAPFRSLAVEYAPEPVPGRKHPLEAYADLALLLDPASA